jgi:hypothetical protein
MLSDIPSNGVSNGQHCTNLVAVFLRSLRTSVVNDDTVLWVGRLASREFRPELEIRVLQILDIGFEMLFEFESHSNSNFTQINSK